MMTHKEWLIQRLGKYIKKQHPKFAVLSSLIDIKNSLTNKVTFYKVGQALMSCFEMSGDVNVFYDFGSSLVFEEQLTRLKFQQKKTYIFVLSHFHYDHFGYFQENGFPWEHGAKRDNCYLVTTNPKRIDPSLRIFSLSCLNILYYFAKNNHLIFLEESKENKGCFSAGNITIQTTNNHFRCIKDMNEVSIQMIVNNKIFLFGDCLYNKSPIFSKMKNKPKYSTIVQLSHHGFDSALKGMARRFSCLATIASYSKNNIYKQRINKQSKGRMVLSLMFFETDGGDISFFF